MRYATLIAGAALAAAACGGTPGPGQPGYAFNLNGTYETEVVASDGSAFDGQMTLATADGGAVSGELSLTSPMSVVGTVEGMIVGSQFNYTLDWEITDSGCTGLAEGTMVVADGGTGASGDLEMTRDECGGAPPTATVTLTAAGAGMN